MDAATAPEEKVGPVGPAQPGGRVPEPMPMLGAASAGSAGGQAGGAAGSGQAGPRPGQATGALDSAGAPLSQHIGALGLGPGAAGRSPLAAAAGPASRESDEGGRRREASGIAPKAPIPTPASQGARKGPAGKDLHASLVGEADDEAWGSFGDFGDGSGWGSVTAAGPGARGSRGVLGVAQGQAAGAQFGPNGVGAATRGRGASQPLRLGGEPLRGAPGLLQQRALGPLSLAHRWEAAAPKNLLSTSVPKSFVTLTDMLLSLLDSQELPCTMLPGLRRHTQRMHSPPSQHVSSTISSEIHPGQQGSDRRLGVLVSQRLHQLSHGVLPSVLAPFGSLGL